MGNVFANTREVSGKSTSNKTIAAFPDVCLSPPSPPAGPLPLPYPITGMASDSADGTGSVVINKKEVGKKNGSKYSKVNGNQPATNSFGAGVVSHKITGALKFAAYSFDVMFEKGGAERFMDMTTQNHMNMANPSFGVSVAKIAPPYMGSDDTDCEELKSDVKEKRDQMDAIENNNEQSNTKTKATEKGTIGAFKTSSGATGVKASNQTMRDALDLEGPPGFENYKNLNPKQKRAKRKSKVCGAEGDYSHSTRGNANHAEAQSIDSIDWSNPPKAITFSIDYPSLQTVTHKKTGKKTKVRNEKKSNWPCTGCKRLLQKACDCKVEIIICLNGEKKDFCKGQQKP